MTKKHSALDDVLADFDAPEEPVETKSARFLARKERVGDRLSGDLEEKTLRWIDPTEARMWARHNRAYDLLTAENCRDLIDGIRAQGRQEFPAIVRRTGEADHPYEVVCGARRHFAVSWLRANNYPNFRYLVEVRDLTDEEAFRLADIENRDREDISDYERAIDYLGALEHYYNGSQKQMAARLEVSTTWLSRYLQLARLPQEIVGAFASIRDLKESHARQLKPLLDGPRKDAVLEAALALEGQGGDPANLVKALREAGVDPKPKAAEKTYRRNVSKTGVKVTRKGGQVTMKFRENLSRQALEAAFSRYIEDRYPR